MGSEESAALQGLDAFHAGCALFVRNRHEASVPAVEHDPTATMLTIESAAGPARVCLLRGVGGCPWALGPSSPGPANTGGSGTAGVGQASVALSRGRVLSRTDEHWADASSATSNDRSTANSTTAP